MWEQKREAMWKKSRKREAMWEKNRKLCWNKAGINVRKKQVVLWEKKWEVM